MVEPDLSVPGHPEVFVVGDLAHVRDQRFPDSVPGVAQAAIQGGRHVARIIAAEVAGRKGERPAFRYRDRGNMATIGKNHAVAEVGRWQVAGWPAWVLWGVVHIAFLVGFRARIAVLWNWLWNYLRNDKGARLITGSPRLRVHRTLTEQDVASLQDQP